MSRYPDLKQEARVLLECGESREGYWTCSKFIEQMKTAVQIAETKSQQWKHIWIFDSSSCHKAYADDALEVNGMNVKPGGKQKVMRHYVDGRSTKNGF